MRFEKENDSIEAKRFDITIRKLIPRTFIKINRGDNTYYFHTFKSRLRGIAIIIQEYAPKKSIISETSHLDTGDEINAPVIELYLSKKSGLFLISNFSATHGIQNFKSDDFSFGVIRTPFRYVLERHIDPTFLRA